MLHTKIITKEDFTKIREDFQKRDLKIVLCHGVYDVVHYGHIEHLVEAKKQGDILVVSITAAKYVKKGPNRPYFNDEQRMIFLSSLEVVDYVMLSEGVTVHDIINYVRPDIYVKGQEYEQSKNDITGNINGEQEAVEKYGGRIYFTRGRVFSSTKILNNHFNLLPPNLRRTSQEITNKYGKNLMDQIRTYIESFKHLKVLVIGDVILDEYIFCNVQGVTSKDGVLSTKYEGEERYTGGALAIARHLSGFSDHVALCSVMGDENNFKSFVKDSMKGINLYIDYEENFITPVKRRFLRRNFQRQEYDKLFSINIILDNIDIKNLSLNKFNNKLENIIGEFDVVLACDYGHGLINEETIKILEEKSKFLAVNCQTNSSNYGMNLITKYKRADCFVVDERELRLAFGQALSSCEELLNDLHKQLSSCYSWVTMGSNGAMGKKRAETNVAIPAVTLHVKDTVGAGDAFYSLAALCARSDIPLDIASLICNTAGAIKTNFVGNERAIQKTELLKFISTILNV